MDKWLPLTPRTLIRCLTELAHIHNLLLQPTEALFWLIGHYDSLTIEQARALVQQYHLEDHKVYIQIGRLSAPPGIYTQAPDNTHWCLFRIISKEESEHSL
jgi:hypothetical protein